MIWKQEEQKKEESTYKSGVCIYIANFLICISCCSCLISFVLRCAIIGVNVCANGLSAVPRSSCKIICYLANQVILPCVVLVFQCWRGVFISWLVTPTSKTSCTQSCCMNSSLPEIHTPALFSSSSMACVETQDEFCVAHWSLMKKKKKTYKGVRQSVVLHLLGYWVKLLPYSVHTLLCPRQNLHFVLSSPD